MCCTSRYEVSGFLRKSFIRTALTSEVAPIPIRVSQREKCDERNRHKYYTDALRFLLSVFINMLAVVDVVDPIRIAADDPYEPHFASGSSSSSRFANNVRMAPSCINGYRRKMS
jgi:hypothetical protein